MQRGAFAPCALLARRSAQWLGVSLRRITTESLERRVRRARVGSGGVIRASAVDLKFIRDNAAAVRQNVLERGVGADVDRVLEMYEEVLSFSAKVADLRRQRNENAAAMKRAGEMTPGERAKCIAEGKALKSEISEGEMKLSKMEELLEDEASKIPNMTHPDSPRGDEENAVCLANVGEKRDFEKEGFKPKGHLDLALDLDIVDFENAARVSGNKFYYMRNAGALLELALINWAMAIAARKGFTVMTTPDVAREHVVAGCGFQPRGESSQVYRVSDSDLCLVGTAEILLGGYYADQILEKSHLPIRIAAFSHCFRREVGSAGSTTRGLYRVHQFSKVEMFVICHPEDSERMLDELRSVEEEMFTALGLHYKVLDMPSLDLGSPAYRKIDIEAWMPGRGSYGEISSASNCTDYQARRLAIRYREKRGDNRYVHTLNATACAVPRMIVAILENFQNPDGSVTVPLPLRPFLAGMEVIRPPAKGKTMSADNTFVPQSAVAASASASAISASGLPSA